jgi:RNA polymerase sigma-70 factor (ECF subfamily)
MKKNRNKKREHLKQYRSQNRFIQLSDQTEEKNYEYLNKTDQELVELTLDEADNYGYLMQKYEQKLKRYIIKLCGGRTDYADDILQSVFIKIYKNLDAFNADLKFFSWVYRIAHNETIDFLRKLKRRPVTYNFDIDAVPSKVVKDDVNIEKEIDRKILAKDLAKAINNLDDKYKKVLQLRYMEDRDYQEISEIIKKPSGTVATLLRQAKEKLKKEILKDKKRYNRIRIIGEE